MLADNDSGDEAGSKVDVTMEQDDDSVGLGSFNGDNTGQNGDDTDESSKHLRQFLAHVNYSCYDTMGLHPDEIAAIKLLDTLTKKKAPLDTSYDEVMKWRIETTRCCRRRRSR